MVWFLLMSGCAGCAPEDERELGPPDLAVKPDPGSGDSGDTGGGDTDTGPLVVPRCTFEITEDDDPANDVLEPDPLPMDTWACGFIDREGDVDAVQVRTTGPGWLEIRVEAESHQSKANMYATIVGLESDEGTQTSGRWGGLDPLNVLYAPAADTYFAILSSQSEGFGSEYGWWFNVRTTKPPVEIDSVEAEPNDTQATAAVAQPGTVYFGTFGKAADADWFVIEIPEDVVAIEYATDAFEYGSASDPDIRLEWGGEDHMYLYTDAWDEAIDVEDAAGSFDVIEQREMATSLKAASPAEFPHDLDMTRLYLRIYDSDESRGDNFHWYAFHYTFVTETK